MTLVQTEPRGASLVQLSEEDLRALKDVLAPDISDPELRVFGKVCQHTGLDPFAKQIYAIMRYSNTARRKVMTIQTGIDGYRLVAERSGMYDGQDPPEYCGGDGAWTDTWLADEPPHAARVRVYKKGVARPIVGVAYWKEYAQHLDGDRLSPMWVQMPRNQLAKCAEALALRKAFPNELSGVYTPEEMDQAGPGADTTAPEGWATYNEFHQAHVRLYERISALGEAGVAQVKAWRAQHGQKGWRMTAQQVGELATFVATLEPDDDPDFTPPRGGRPPAADEPPIDAAVLDDEAMGAAPAPNPADPDEAPFDQAAHVIRDLYTVRVIRKKARDVGVEPEDIAMLVKGATGLRTDRLGDCSDEERRQVWLRLGDIGQDRRWLERYWRAISDAEARARHASAGGAA